MVKAARLLEKTRIPFMAHTLQLSISHGIKTGGIDKVLAKCRKIVGHFKHSSTKTTVLDESATPLKLVGRILHYLVFRCTSHVRHAFLLNLFQIQDVPTRWGSTQYDKLTN